MEFSLDARNSGPDSKASLPAIESIGLPAGCRIVPACLAHSTRLKEFILLFKSNEGGVDDSSIVDTWFERAKDGPPFLWALEQFGTENEATGDEKTYPGPFSSHPVVGLVSLDRSSEGRGWDLHVFASSSDILPFLEEFGRSRARLLGLTSAHINIVTLDKEPRPFVIELPSPSDFLVRPARTTSDLIGLENLWKKIGWGYDDVPSWLSKSERGEKAVWVLTTTSGQIVGSLVAALTDSEGDPEMCDLPHGLVSLSYLGVDPALHGKGLGGFLLAYLDSEVKLMGYSSIALNTGLDNPAQRLYERSGYRFFKIGPRKWTLATMTDVPIEQRVCKFYRKNL